MVVLFSWPLVMRVFFPAPPVEPPALEEPAQSSEPPAAGKPAPGPVANQAPANTGSGKPAAIAQTTDVAAREITVETDYWSARLSNRGGVATSWTIQRYPVNGTVQDLKPAEGEHLELIPQDLPDNIDRPFSLRLPWVPEFADKLRQSNFRIEGLGASEDRITLTGGDRREISFVYSSPEVVARKTFVITGNSFVIDARADVTVNGSDQPVQLVLGPRIGDQSDKQTGTYTTPPQVIAYTRTGSRDYFTGSSVTPQFTIIQEIDHSTRQIVIEKPLASDVDSVKLVAEKGAMLIGYARVVEASPDRRRLTLDALPAGAAPGIGVAQGTDTIRRGYQWAGVTDHYFAMLAVSDQPVPELTLTNFDVKTGSDTVREHPSVAVPIPSTLHVYVGPKDRDLLITVGQSLGSNFEEVIDWGMFAFAVRPFIPLLAGSLKSLAHSLGNYGWAIVVITVIINLLLSPLRFYSSVKMKKAARHQPRLKELQERMKKLKDNPKKSERELAQLQQEQLAIMKEANPLGGCMPLLLQMPIFWAVYLYLSSSLDVRHAAWMGWIKDLSRPDSLYILPIVMCVTMIASTKLMPQPPTTDPSMKMQRAMMIWVMPIMLTYFFFFSAPSGLVLYWMVGNVVGVLIQLVINKKTAHLTAELQPETGAKKAKGTPDTRPGKKGKGKTSQRRGDAEAEGF
jgi:YidC/Oxa1 family membrane protein insertase